MFVLTGDGSAQFLPGSHFQTVPPPSTGPSQVFFQINGFNAVVMGDTVNGNSGFPFFNESSFPITSPSHFRINGIPVAATGISSAPPGLSTAISAGSNTHFSV